MGSSPIAALSRVVTRHGPGRVRSLRKDETMVRNCFAKFATGVVVVSMRDSNKIHGITVNCFTTVSLNPPLVLVSIDRQARAHGLLAGQSFTINVLTGDQAQLAVHFSGHPQDNLAIVWLPGYFVPRLAGALAHLECQPWDAYDVADHTLYVGLVSACAYRSGASALGFFESRYVQIAEDNEGGRSNERCCDSD